MIQGQEQEYFVWHPESRPFTVRLRWDLIPLINVEVMRGYAVTRRRGTEAGGILLGQFGPGSEPVVTIEAFEPVPCEYSLGPSYLLSESDIATFRAALARSTPATTGAYAVGYWRGHTRDGLQLESADLALFQESFSDPRALALVIKPAATRPSEARFFLQENSILSIGGTAPEFPFIQSRPGNTPPPAPLPPASVDVPITPVQQTVAAAVTPVPSLEVQKPPPPQPGADPVSIAPSPYLTAPPSFTSVSAPRSSKRASYWLALALIGALVGGIGGYEYAGGVAGKESTFPTDTQAPVILLDPQLKVRAQGDLLTISWNPQSAAVSEAQRGVLNIEDAGVRGQDMITKRQLRQGRTTYRPVGEFVKFRLELIFKNDLTLSGNADWSRPSRITR